MPASATSPIIISELMSISIGMLREKNLLNRKGTLKGDLNWINSFTKVKTGTISFEICTQVENPYIVISYSTGRQDFEYSIPLVKVLSNLRKGYIWYFDVENKKCSKLYMLNDQFETRQKVLAAGAIYTNQLISKGFRNINTERDLVRRLFKITLQEIKPHFLSTYRGTITKRQRSVNRARARLLKMGLGTYSAIEEYFGIG